MFEDFPKIIHFCWFGNKPLSSLANKCIESWKLYMPSHELMLWNENNSPMHLSYMQVAYANGNWANLSNLTRLYALQKYGGWYFDTDIELLKSPDFSIFMENCYVGMETKPHEKKHFINNACVLSLKNHYFITRSLEKLLAEYDGNESAHLSSPVMTTDLLKEFGFKGFPGVFNGVRVLPYDYFYPSGWSEKYDATMRTVNTIAIHHNDASWINSDFITHDNLKELLRNYDISKKRLDLVINGDIKLKELLKINYHWVRNKFRF